MPGHQDSIRGSQLDFPRAVKAHSVRPVFYCEDAAEMFMVAAEDKCESPSHKAHSSTLAGGVRTFRLYPAT
jgi:hypothetical protein